jgi:hypothetical protein
VEPPPGCPTADTGPQPLLPALDDPNLDSDDDGIADIRDQCRDAAEDPDGYLDDDGCPEPYGPRETEHPLPMVDTDEHPARLE